MSLTDVTPPDQTEIRKACDNIRKKFDSVLNHAGVAIQQVHNIVNKYGRSAIAAELGSDAAALLSVYNSLKDAVQTGKEVTLSDLPE